MRAEQLTRDARHALRTIAGMPILSIVVVVSLAIGIGVNTVVFSWIQAVIFHPLPGVRGSGSLHHVSPRSETGSYPGTSWLEFADIRERMQSLDGAIAFRMVPFNIGEAARTERSYGMLVSGNYFSMLELRPALGRFIRADEASRAGGEPVAVISHDFWQSRYGGSTGVLGQPLRVNGQDLTIVGVAPRAFQGTTLGLTFDMWVPATLAPTLLAGSRELEDRGIRGYSVLARLKSGATSAQAQTELQATMRDLAARYPDTNRDITGGEVLPFWQAPLGPQRMFASALAILQGIMLLLLLAVCGNTANLVLARATTRHREVGVRLALGAGPSRIATLLLAENMILALIGAALGVLIAVWGTDALRAAPMITTFPIKFQTSLDLVSLAFAVGLGVACGLIFGLAPAWQLARVDPQVALRTGATGGGRSRMRHTLMGVEVGLALMVLVAAGLFFRSFSETRDIDPGFKREGVLLASYNLTGRNMNDEGARTFASRLLTRLRATPGVEAAAVALTVPLDIHGSPMRTFTIEGRPRNEQDPDRALMNVVTPDYLNAMGIPLRAGRDFADMDDATTAPQVIVNEEFVHRYVSGGEALGRRVQVRDSTYQIVGVARNSRYDSFSESALPFIYFSYRDRPYDRGEIHVRTRTGGESLLAAEVARAVREIDPTLPVYDVRTLSEHVEKNLFLRRIPARMFTVLGPLLLLLAAIGIYAVVAYTVSHRTTEIGVRIALGATAQGVVAQIVRESLRVIAVGTAVGWMIAFIINIHVVPGRGIDKAVYLGVPLVLLMVATFASWLPARRATRVDPVVALRQE
jgi:predicted permease